MQRSEWLSGSRFEEIILGHAAPILTNELHKSLVWEEFEHALWNVVGSCTENAFIPKTEYMRCLLRKLQDGEHGRQKEVRFYDTCGMMVDYLHGVDCFFSCGRRLVTVDLCLCPEKKRERKEHEKKPVTVDFLLSPQNFFISEGDLTPNEKSIGKVAAEITEQFERIKRTPRKFRNLLPKGIIVAGA